MSDDLVRAMSLDEDGIDLPRPKVVRRLKVIPEWQPIATAPKEPGALVLLWDADVAHPEVASWSSWAE